jgi:hypothetical protein
MVWIPIAIEYMIVGVNIKVPTGKEVSENGRCLEIGNFDGDIGVWEVKRIPYRL